MIEYSCTSDPGWWLWYYRVNFDTTNILANERAYYKILVNYTGVSPNWYWYVFAFDGDKRNLGDSGHIPSTTTRSSDGAIQTIDNPVLYSYYDSTNDVTFYSCPIVNASIQYGPNPNITYAASSSDYYNLPYSTWAPLARAYFDNFVPGQGVGEVTLQTDAPSQLLTFTSRELGQSFKYWIRGDQTIELYTPGEEPSEVIIFRNGAFADAVRDGFDIVNYKFHNGGDVYSDVTEYLFTNWGIIDRENAYASINQYIISDGCIKYYGSVTSSSAWTNYFIPIKSLPGNSYDKIRFEAALLNVSSGDAYDIIKCTAMTFDREAYTRTYPNGGDSGNIGQYTSATFEEFGNVISGLSSIDYIAIAGCNGTPAWKNIKLIKDSVNVSEVPRNVIFENGRWGAGVTTDFDFTCKEFSASEQSMDINSYATHLYYSRYTLWLHHTSQTVPYVIDGNYISHSPNSVHSSNNNTAKIYIPIKRAYGYTKCKVKMGQTSVGSGSMNFVSCAPGKINSNRQLSSIQYYEVTNPSGINEYEIDISGSEYCDYIALGCDEGTCVWQSIVLE